MAEYTINKFTYGGNTYKLKDDVSGYKTTDTDTNTWRNIKVNGTEVLSTSISSGAVNFKQGTGINITNSSGTLEVSSTVVNTDSKLALSQAASGTTLYPVIGSGTTAAERCFDTTGFAYTNSSGTASSIGSSVLALGNSTASGTAGNKQAVLRMYGSNAKYANITLDAPSADITLKLPTSGGTLALTSQIPTVNYPVTSVNSKTGAVSLTASDVGALPSNTTYVSTITTTAGTHSTISSKSGAVSFNVPTKTSHLTNDSGFLTNSTLYEANLQWGGKDFSAAYGCIDAAMIDVLGANRFAFLKAEGLTIEYSTNGGTSWTDYGATDAQKVGLFSNGNSFYLGKHSTAGSCTVNDQLRVTIATSAAGLYTILNKIAILMSTSGSTIQVLIERALESTPTTFQIHKDWTNISGWSGWNILNISSLVTYGNTANSQYGRVRFTFKATAVNTTYSAASINKILGFGGVGWTTPSNMAATGHLYSYDSSQNAYFPAQVTATRFNGPLTGNVTGNVSGTASNVTGTVAIANGGTGQTTAGSAINALLNGLPTWTADPTDTTYFVRQDTGGSATYGKVQATTLWNYISGKLPAWSKASTKPTYTASEVGALPSNHTYTTSIATSSATNQITLAHGTKYAITAGGTSYVFTMPSDNNTDTKVTQAYSTANNYYPLLATATAGASSTSSRGDTTAILNNNFTINPSTQTLEATKIAVNDLNVGVITAEQIGFVNVNGSLDFDASLLTDARVLMLPDHDGKIATVDEIPGITLNGTATTSPSFYAPTSAGTSGYYLKSSGSGAPTWTAFPSIPSGNILYGTGTPTSSTGANGDIYCVYTN